MDVTLLFLVSQAPRMFLEIQGMSYAEAQLKRSIPQLHPAAFYRWELLALPIAIECDRYDTIGPPSGWIFYVAFYGSFLQYFANRTQVAEVYLIDAIDFQLKV